MFKILGKPTCLLRQAISFNSFLRNLYFLPAFRASHLVADYIGILKSGTEQAACRTKGSGWFKPGLSFQLSGI